MAKTKTPFFGLGSQGSIANTLTSQKRGSDTLLRLKPTPTYTRTLPQLYQRWLYEDYAYLWRQQDQYTKRAYAAHGSKYHLTGFQYWMKYQLIWLPDIAGWWKLDDNQSALLIDSSRNNNPATAIGTSPATGQIDGALYFDGANDWLNAGDDPSLNPASAMSLELWLRLDALGVRYGLVNRYIGTADLPYMLRREPANTLHFSIGPLPVRVINSILAPAINTWYHIIATYDGRYSRIYIDGALDNSVDHLTDRDIEQAVINTGIGATGNGGWKLKGYLDNVIIYNRALDATEALRKSARRYPE